MTSFILILFFSFFFLFFFGFYILRGFLGVVVVLVPSRRGPWFYTQSVEVYARDVWHQDAGAAGGENIYWAASNWEILPSDSCLGGLMSGLGIYRESGVVRLCRFLRTGIVGRWSCLHIRPPWRGKGMVGLLF